MRQQRDFWRTTAQEWETRAQEFEAHALRYWAALTGMVRRGGAVMRRAMVTALLMLAAALLLLTLTLLAGVQLLVALARPRTADVLALLADLPALLRAAEADDARAVLQELFEQITLAPHQALTARPRPAYKNLLIAVGQPA